MYLDLSQCVTHLVILDHVTTSLRVLWHLIALDNYLELPIFNRNLAVSM